MSSVTPHLSASSSLYRSANQLVSDGANPSQRLLLPSSHGGLSPTSSMSRTSMPIQAGRGVGPFSIGMDIGPALVIASQYEENPQVIVDRSNPFLHDTLIDLPDLGFRLCFDGYSQRLHVIILSLPPASSAIGTPRGFSGPQETAPASSVSSTTNVLRFVLNFSFNNIPLIRSARCPPDLRHVYRVCGPTIPGHYAEESMPELLIPTDHDSTRTSSVNFSTHSVYYYLKYPGLAFRFPIPRDDYEILKSSDEDLLPFTLPASSSRGFNAPIVDRLFVFPPDSPLTNVHSPPWLSPSLILPSSVESTTETSYEEITSTSSMVDPISSVEGFDHPNPDTKTSIPPSLVPKDRQWNVQVNLRKGIRFPWGGSIRFGAALQDVYAEVGAPDRVTLKDIDIVGIMSSHADFKSYLEHYGEEITSQSLGLTDGLTHSHESPAADYFCNYFLRGFDLLICGVTHRVKKFVLHVNFPGHVQFGDYRRCFFSIPLKGEPFAVIDVDTQWDDIESYLGTPSPPLLVDYPLLRQSSTTIHPASSSRSIEPTTVRKFYGYPGWDISQSSLLAWKSSLKQEKSLYGVGLKTARGKTANLETEALELTFLFPDDSSNHWIE